jgi:hypothetical protein
MTETRTISACDAETLAFANPTVASGPWTYVAEQDNGSGRWSSHHTLVVKHDEGSYWGLDYEMGLTEYQEHEFPWERVGDDEQLPMVRLFPREVTTTEYLTRQAYLRKTGGEA